MVLQVNYVLLPFPTVFSSFWKSLVSEIITYVSNLYIINAGWVRFPHYLLPREMIRICIVTICLDKKLITFEWDSSSKISQLSLRKLPEICDKSELSLTDKILFFALHF